MVADPGGPAAAEQRPARRPAEQRRDAEGPEDCLLCRGPCAAGVTLVGGCRCCRPVHMHARCCLVLLAKTGNRCPVCRETFRCALDGRGRALVEIGESDLCNLQTAERRLSEEANRRLVHVVNSALVAARSGAQAAPQRVRLLPEPALAAAGVALAAVSLLMLWCLPGPYLVMLALAVAVRMR